MNLFKSKNKQSFERVKGFLADIEWISCGGCGIAALALYDAAISEGKKPKIVYLYGDWPSEYDKKQTNENFKLGLTTVAESCMHIVVDIEGEFYDVNGKVEKHYWNKYCISHTDEVTREHLIQSLTTGGWNSMFNRKKWFPKIKQLLGWENVDLPLECDHSGHYHWQK